MKYYLPITLFFCLSLGMLACAGNKAGTEAEPLEEVTQEPLPNQYHDFPCAVFSDDVLKTHFGVALGAASRSESKNGAVRICNCHWDNVSKQVSLFVQPIFNNKQAADTYFKNITNPNTQIITAETTTSPQTTTIGAYDTVLENIGDEAMWSSKLNQLIVRKKDEVFQVTVMVHESADQNQKLATTIAGLMLQ